MAILICAATQSELAAIAPAQFPEAQAIPEMQPVQAKLKNREAVFIVTGVGPINTALAMGLCFGLTHESSASKIKINAIIYAGLAGAFDLEANPLCSIWRVDREIWPEYGLNDGVAVTARAFSHPLWQRKNGEDIYEEIKLQDIADLPGIKKKGDAWPACASLTVAGVSASFARKEALWNRWHIPLENMEGFAAAYAALRADLPIVEIRSVSNKVGPRSRAEKDFEGALAALGGILPALNLV